MTATVLKGKKLAIDPENRNPVAFHGETLTLPINKVISPADNMPFTSHRLLLIKFLVPLLDTSGLRIKQSLRGVMNLNGRNAVSPLNGIHHVLPDCNVPEDGMHSIKVRARNVGNEKLAAVGTRASIGHRENPWAVMLKASQALVFKLVTGPTTARAGRVSSLDHKSWDDSVKQ